MVNDKTTELVIVYDDHWKNGIASYDEKRLRSILAADLKFEGPTAGKLNSAGGFPFGTCPVCQNAESPSHST